MKLCVAMCFVGSPTLEFFDEPTTGVDPVSRRRLLNIIKNIQGSSMIMITHHTQEAEFLCDKIAIMVNGQISCYGTPDELRAQYVNGYMVTVIHV